VLQIGKPRHMQGKVDVKVQRFRQKKNGFAPARYEAVIMLPVRRAANWQSFLTCG
jgi:hypothetical protein